jgi:drug/metabolite transporter (DMT)-like permease
LTPKLSISHPLVQMHLAVFLWGFTAILGKLISVNALTLVFLRMSIAAFVFYLIPYTRAQIKNLSRKQILNLALIGFFICIHWLCFYHSIKVFNSSSIALICLGTSSMFVIWIEFLTRLRTNISGIDIAISLVAILGMGFIYFGNENELALKEYSQYKWAIFYGTMASLLAAIFTIMNKKITQGVEPFAISFIEMLTGSIILFIYLCSQNLLGSILEIQSLDWLWILMLTIICTNIPFLLSVFALKKLDAFTVTLSVNLEPIYGIFFAAILFKELTNFNNYFFIGAALILVSVFLPLIFNRINATN